MLNRIIKTKLEINLKQMPAVALLGARQLGKTTLAKSLGIPSVYLDLESPEDLLKLSNPLSFFSMCKDKLIILDEIQRAPDLFKVLRGVIDENIYNGRKSSQFLLLGSASMDLLKQSSESLAGRISYVEMSGFNVLEINNNKFEKQKLWLRGGFPDSYLSISDELSMNYLENLIRTYIERDVPQFGFRIPSSRLRRLWTMLAHLQGEPLNASKLAASLEVDAKTVSYYIDILEDLLLIRRLQPYYTNVKKRLVKTPRFYIRDSGITHRLLGINNFESLLSNPILGKSWEAFVIENILSVLPNLAETYYYRTAAGAEIDLLIKFSSDELWAIEIKNSSSPNIGKSFNNSCEELKVTKKFIVYGGEDEFIITNSVTVCSLKNFLDKIQNYKF